MTVIAPKNDIMLASASAVDEICRPLQRIGITYFGFVRTYDDGTMFDINNNAEFSEAYYYKTKCHELYAVEADPRVFEDGFLFAYSGIIDHIDEVRQLADSHNASNLMVLIEKHSDYCDLWHFGSPPTKQEMINIYLRHMDFLKSFTFYFRDKAGKLIDSFKKNLMLVNRTKHSETEDIILAQQQKSTLNQSPLNLPTKRYYLGEKYNNTYLTKREVECIKWSIFGKTAQETAIILNVSKRTVEAHLDKIRQKLHCHKQSHLIKTIIELGIM